MCNEWQLHSIALIINLIFNSNIVPTTKRVCGRIWVAQREFGGGGLLVSHKMHFDFNLFNFEGKAMCFIDC